MKADNSTFLHGMPLLPKQGEKINERIEKTKHYLAIQAREMMDSKLTSKYASCWSVTEVFG